MESVFLLQGSKELGPNSWRSRTVRHSPLTAREATTIGHTKDSRRQAVISVIVRGMGVLDDDERRLEERRSRKAVLNMRSCMSELLRSGKLGAAALPVVLDVDRAAVAERRGLNQLMEERLRALVGAAAADGQGGAQQGGGPLPKAPKRIKVVGQQSWMGMSVLRKEAAGKVPRPPTSRSASKAIVKSCTLPQGERRQVQLAVVTAEDGDDLKLPPAIEPGEAPWAAGTDRRREVGQLFSIRCKHDSAAEQGAGSLVVMGNVDEELRESAAVARAFLRLHAAWITAWLGKKPARDPSSDNIRLHLSSASVSKGGDSAGAAICVALVAWLWGVEVRSFWVAVTGDATLSGSISGVGGMREKALAAGRDLYQTRSGLDGGGSTAYQACLVVPRDNCDRGVVVEIGDEFDGTAIFKVFVPRGISSRLTVLGASTLFELITIMFPRAKPAPRLARRPRVPPVGRLAVVRTLFTCERGAAVQVIECGLFEDGTGERIYTGSIKPGVRDAIEAGLTWLHSYWHEDVVANYQGRTHHRPVDKGFDLHFHLPSSAIQDEAAVSCAAMVALLSLLFRRRVPDGVAVVAECRADGELVRLRYPDGALLLSATKANGMTRLVVTTEDAVGLRALQQRSPAKLGGVQVVGVDLMAEVMEEVFPGSDSGGSSSSDSGSDEEEDG